MKRLRITIEGKTYDVTVEVVGESAGPPLPAAPAVTAGPAASVPPAIAAAAVPAAGETAHVVSQLAGTVVSVAVDVGQSVVIGDTLVIIEAMKMNTSVIAPRAGVVSTVAVKAGVVVEEGQTLLTLA